LTKIVLCIFPIKGQLKCESIFPIQEFHDLLSQSSYTNFSRENDKIDLYLSAEALTSVSRLVVPHKMVNTIVIDEHTAF